MWKTRSISLCTFFCSVCSVLLFYVLLNSVWYIYLIKNPVLVYFSHGTDLWNKTEQTDCSVPQRWWFILNRWHATKAARLVALLITAYVVDILGRFLSFGSIWGGYLLPAGHPRSPPGRPGAPDPVDIIWLRSAIVTIMQSFDQDMPPKCHQFQRKTVNNICYARFYQYVIELTSFCNQIPENSVSSNLPWRLGLTISYAV